MTSTPSEQQHRLDLARLRGVRDRIDREHAQPPDVEAFARAAHMSAGQASRRASPDGGPSVSAMNSTIHDAFRPYAAPEASLAFYRD